jgi:hypothetical protein
MSTGGVFKIIANDGKADRMIMATELLKKRISDIMCAKTKMGLKDNTPTLLDIEKTHVIFVNARFKPFAALGYEYQKANGNKSVSWGQTTQWSIPQFGDFLYDFVADVQIAATSCLAGVVPAFPALPASPGGAYTTPGAVTTSTSSSIIYYSNVATTGVNFRHTFEYVDLAGNVQTVGAASTNFVRYCEYPGERLFKNVYFQVNGNPLDQYSSNATLFYRKFRITPDIETGWKRLVGQEVQREGWSDLLTIAGASRYLNNAVNQVDTNGAPLTGGPTTSAVTSRRYTQIVDGPQTAQAVQPLLEMWVPLLFWFNKDARLAVPSVAIPYGQRYITIDIEAQANIVFAAPGNLFLRYTFEQWTDSTGAVGGVSVTNYTKNQILTPALASNSTIDPTQQIVNIDLYCNNIFVSPEIHDIYIKRISFNLIRVYKEQTQRCVNATDSILMSQLKWPIEYFFLGLRPVVNISATNQNQWRDWHRLTAVSTAVMDVSQRASGIYAVAADTILTAKPMNSQITGERIQSPLSVESVDAVSVQAHGIVIYSLLKSSFFRDYSSYTYSEHNIRTPEDKGALLVNFALHPTQYQPSGHVNVSRVREFYINYVSTYISSSQPADMLVVASAINFLMISDGSAILRYST